MRDTYPPDQSVDTEISKSASVGSDEQSNPDNGNQRVDKKERRYSNREWANVVFHLGALMIAAAQQDKYATEPVDFNSYQPSITVDAEQGYDDQSIYTPHDPSDEDRDINPTTAWQDDMLDVARHLENSRPIATANDRRQD